MTTIHTQTAIVKTAMGSTMTVEVTVDYLGSPQSRATVKGAFEKAPYRNGRAYKENGLPNGATHVVLVTIGPGKTGKVAIKADAAETINAMKDKAEEIAAGTEFHQQLARDGQRRDLVDAVAVAREEIERRQNRAWERGDEQGAFQTADLEARWDAARQALLDFDAAAA